MSLWAVWNSFLTHQSIRNDLKILKIWWCNHVELTTCVESRESSIKDVHKEEVRGGERSSKFWQGKQGQPNADIRFCTDKCALWLFTSFFSFIVSKYVFNHNLWLLMIFPSYVTVWECQILISNKVAECVGNLVHKSRDST